MMTHRITLPLLAGLLSFSGCSSDSKNAADKANDKKIEAQSAAISDDAKDDAKKVAGAMVDLASMGMTEFELSRLAAQKATNPQVRIYAQQTLSEHQQDQQALRNLASQLSLTLPSTLSNDGKDRLDELRGKTGTAFDLQYLTEMTKVNDQATDVADDLDDKAPNDAVRKFARKLGEGDKKHQQRAQELRNVLD